jgi:peptidoglycan/LPS O-acetylase OafA/YrhL
MRPAKTNLQHTDTFLKNLRANPFDFLTQFFSFLGHYGVQIFIFLSGYGIAISYARNKWDSYKSFLLSRLNKIYPILFFAILFLFLYKVGLKLIFPAKEINLFSFVNEALLKLTLLSNLVPGEALSITGPWWFFSLIFQLYLLAPLLIRLKGSHLLLCILASWVIQFLVLFFSPNHIEFIRVNFIGYIPEFCLGIYFAKAPVKKLSNYVVLFALAVFLVGFFNPFVWVISFVSVPILTLAAYSYVSPPTNNFLSDLFTFFGKNSLYLFAIHGLCRPPFVALGNKSVAWSVVSAIAFIVFVVALSVFFKYSIILIQNLFLISIRRSDGKKYDHDTGR